MRHLDSDRDMEELRHLAQEAHAAEMWAKRVALEGPLSLRPDDGPRHRAYRHARECEREVRRLFRQCEGLITTTPYGTGWLRERCTSIYSENPEVPEADMRKRAIADAVMRARRFVQLGRWAAYDAQDNSGVWIVTQRISGWGEPITETIEEAAQRLADYQRYTGKFTTAVYPWADIVMMQSLGVVRHSDTGITVVNRVLPFQEEG